MMNTGVLSEPAHHVICCLKGRFTSNRSVKNDCAERIIVAVVCDCVCDMKIYVVQSCSLY